MLGIAGIECCLSLRPPSYGQSLQCLFPLSKLHLWPHPSLPNSPCCILLSATFFSHKPWKLSFLFFPPTYPFRLLILSLFIIFIYHPYLALPFSLLPEHHSFSFLATMSRKPLRSAKRKTRHADNAQDASYRLRLAEAQLPEDDLATCPSKGHRYVTTSGKVLSDGRYVLPLSSSRRSRPSHAATPKPRAKPRAKSERYTGALPKLVEACSQISSSFIVTKWPVKTLQSFRYCAI